MPQSEWIFLKGIFCRVEGWPLARLAGKFTFVDEVKAINVFKPRVSFCLLAEGKTMRVKTI